jgi:hypothetical protein
MYAQTGQSLGIPLNSALESEMYPSISGNGKTMILQSTTGEGGEAEVVISYLKGGVWTRPEAVPNVKQLNSKTSLSPDYSLSFDGNIIAFSSPKYGGIGGTDIWLMERTANGWKQSVNPGKPINTPRNEGDPSLSPDGRFLYFVRYTDRKTPEGKLCGKILVSEKTGNLWKEPKELPLNINMGCECNPRILADNQTLIFSSMRSGGKGGLDLYISRLDDTGNWSEPKPLDFINTNKDDQYVSVPASGDYIYYTGTAKKGTDIYRMKLPDEFKPKKVILKEGNVKDQNQKIFPSRVTAFDLNKNRIAALYESDFSGNYQIYLTEGSLYDFSVSGLAKGYSYYSEFIDLTALAKYSEIKTDINLSPLKKGSVILLSNLSVNNDGKISDKSAFEIMRIQRLFQDNPELKAEIAVHKDKVLKDTLPNPSLTELLNDSALVADPSDSTGIRKIKISKVIYHNDRTQKDAEVIVKILVSKGIPSINIIPKGYGDSTPLYPEDPEKARLNTRIELIIK